MIPANKERVGHELGNVITEQLLKRRRFPARSGCVSRR